MRHRGIFLLAALTVFAAVRPATAQKFVPKAIHFEGAPDYSNQELMDAAGLKKGVVLDFAEMGDHSKQLLATGVFATVAFKFDGLYLTFMLTPSPDLYPVQIQNLPLVPGKDLDEKLHAQIPLYHGKVPADGGLQESVRAALQQMLVAQGLNATVVATVSANPASRKVNAVVYSITSPPVMVGIQHIDGVSDALRAPLQHLLDQVTKSQFDTKESAGNLESAVEMFYQDLGYAAAKATAVRSGDAEASAHSVVVPFSITVREGRVYKIGTVHLPPGTPVTQDDIDKTLAPHPGGAPDGVRLRTLWAEIASAYKAKGQLDCKVTPHPSFDDASAVVNYTVDVDPGPVYHLGFVKFDNVSDAMRTLLIKNWQMMPGDAFDEGYVASFITKAQQQDPVLQRSLAGVKTTFDATADPQTHNVNVVIHLAR